jgi:hypothetical protein
MSVTPIPVELKMAVIERYGWNCLCCGRPTHRYPDSKVRPDTLSFDHVIPEKFGGLTTFENLQPLCMACNLHKGVDTIDLREAARGWNHALEREQRRLASRRKYGIPGEFDPRVTAAKELRSTIWSTSLWNNRPPGGELHPYWTRRDVKRWNWPALKSDVQAMPPCPVREKLAVQQSILAPAKELVRV